MSFESTFAQVLLHKMQLLWEKHTLVLVTLSYIRTRSTTHLMLVKRQLCSFLQRSEAEIKNAAT
jgi:hypothetical protein